MPELPEVEVTRRRIAPLLVGRRIRCVRTTPDSYLFLTRPERLRRRLRGRTITALHRRGKYLVAELDEGSRLVLHLGMTGQLFSASASSVRLLSASARAALHPEEQVGFRPDVHTHLCLSFEDGGDPVYLRDVRKFGKVALLRRGTGPRAAAALPSRIFCSTNPRSPGSGTSTPTRCCFWPACGPHGARAA
jgi:formamidopyrimidine-DNA glycosylase